jgi:hypothetical protein
VIRLALSHVSHSFPGRLQGKPARSAQVYPLGLGISHIGVGFSARTRQILGWRATSHPCLNIVISKRLASAGLLIALSVFGCGRSDVVQKFAPADDQALARGYIQQLRDHQFYKIEAAMDPSLAATLEDKTLEEMADAFPAGDPVGVTLVGANSVHGPDWSTINLTYEFQFRDAWVLSNVALKKQAGNTTIVGFHVYSEPQSLDAQNRFTLRGKSVGQYAILAAAVIVPLFILWTLVLCLRTNFIGRKWPWVVFILFGVGKLAMNWTTGAWAVAFTYVQVLGAGAFALPPGPWTISVSIPLGAIVFLWRRGALRLPPRQIPNARSQDPLESPSPH